MGSEKGKLVQTCLHRNRFNEFCELSFNKKHGCVLHTTSPIQENAYTTESSYLFRMLSRFGINLSLNVRVVWLTLYDCPGLNRVKLSVGYLDGEKRFLYLFCNGRYYNVFTKAWWLRRDKLLRKAPVYFEIEYLEEKMDNDFS